MAGDCKIYLKYASFAQAFLQLFSQLWKKKGFFLCYKIIMAPPLEALFRYYVTPNSRLNPNSSRIVMHVIQPCILFNL